MFNQVIHHFPNGLLPRASDMLNSGNANGRLSAAASAARRQIICELGK